MYKYDLQESEVELLRKLYFDEFKSKLTISKIMNIGEKRIVRTFKQQGWNFRTLKEAAKHVERVGLNEWRKNNHAWCKGLTKDDPRMKSLIEKGRETQIKNEKSKGKNNPMYGKMSRTKNGYRKDLGHSVRSSWEANFARILNTLGIEYEYEKYTFSLKEGDTYTPDFYIPSKNKFYEIKGWEKSDKHYRFIEQYPDKKLIIIKEEEYGRILKKFADRISISDGESLYTKSDIEKLFNNYIEREDVSNISIQKFQKEIRIHTRTIQRLFGSQKKFKGMFMEKITNIEKKRIYDQFLIFHQKNFPRCYRREFYKFFSRAASIIQKYYNNRFGDFLREFYTKNSEIERPLYDRNCPFN